MKKVIRWSLCLVGKVLNVIQAAERTRTSHPKTHLSVRASQLSARRNSKRRNGKLASYRWNSRLLEHLPFLPLILDHLNQPFLFLKKDFYRNLSCTAEPFVRTRRIPFRRQPPMNCPNCGSPSAA